MQNNVNKMHGYTYITQNNKVKEESELIEKFINSTVLTI